MIDFTLKILIWITFLRNRESLPTKLNVINSKMKYEIMSGAVFWEDEGLLELRNHHLQDAFKYVLNHRMKLIVGTDYDVGVMRSKSFDKSIFEMAKKHFPNWIGFDKSRCSYNSEHKDRIIKIKKVEEWRFQKELSI